MKEFMKGKLGTVIILIFTLVLAGVAVFTAVRLYQLRNQPVAPNVPSSLPQAQEVGPFPIAPGCNLNFRLISTTSTPTGTPTSTPTGTPTATPTGTPTPTPTPVLQCNSSCTSSSQCPSNLTCFIPSGSSVGNCRNAACTGETDCICATATPTVTPTVPGSTPTPTPPSLPKSGVDWPSYVGFGLGILVIVGSLILAL